MNKPFFLLALAGATLLTACRSVRNTTTTTTTATTTTTTTIAGETGKNAAGVAGKTTDTANSAAATAAYVARVRANAQTARCVTARINMSITAGSKDITTGGTLRLKRDDVVQLSLTLLGFEVARMEFSPNDVLIIDRYNRRYVRAAYDDVAFLRQSGLDFHALQSLFWGELYRPTGTTDAAYVGTTEGTHTRLVLPNSKGLKYDFLTTTLPATIDRVDVGSATAGRPGRFSWAYADYASLGGRPFPSGMTCEISLPGKTYGFSLTLSRLNNNSDWEAHTTPSSKYTRLRVEDVLGSLLK